MRRVPSHFAGSKETEFLSHDLVIEPLDFQVKSRIKRCKIGTNLILTCLTLPPSVAIVEVFPGSAARSIGSGRWVVQTRFERDNHTCRLKPAVRCISGSLRVLNSRECA